MRTQVFASCEISRKDNESFKEKFRITIEDLHDEMRAAAKETRLSKENVTRSISDHVELPKISSDFAIWRRPCQFSLSADHGRIPPPRVFGDSLPQ